MEGGLCGCKLVFLSSSSNFSILDAFLKVVRLHVFFPAAPSTFFCLHQLCWPSTPKFLLFSSPALLRSCCWILVQPIAIKLPQMICRSNAHSSSLIAAYAPSWVCVRHRHRSSIAPSTQLHNESALSNRSSRYLHCYLYCGCTFQTLSWKACFSTSPGDINALTSSLAMNFLKRSRYVVSTVKLLLPYSATLYGKLSSKTFVLRLKVVKKGSTSRDGPGSTAARRHISWARYGFHLKSSTSRHAKQHSAPSSQRDEVGQKKVTERTGHETLHERQP